MATNKLTDEEVGRISKDMQMRAQQSIKDFFIGMAKGVTTDLPGFLMDVADKLAGDTSTLGEKDRSAQLFEAMTGIKTSSGEGGANELVGSMINPVGAGKAIILPAALLGKDVIAAQKLLKAKMSPATVFDQTGIYKEAGKLKAVKSDVLSITDQERLTDGFVSLEKVLDHPALYDLLPDMKYLSVTSTDPGSGSAVLGELRRGIRAIGIDPMLPERDFKAILLHEVQHELQNRFRFKKGGSPEQFRILDPSLSNDKAYNLYRQLPGEQEATFVERTAGLTQAQLDLKVKQLLQAGGSPSSPEYLWADLERFTNP